MEFTIKEKQLMNKIIDMDSDNIIVKKGYIKKIMKEQGIEWAGQVAILAYIDKNRRLDYIEKIDVSNRFVKHFGEDPTGWFYTNLYENKKHLLTLLNISKNLIIKINLKIGTFEVNSHAKGNTVQVSGGKYININTMEKLQTNTLSRLQNDILESEE